MFVVILKWLFLLILVGEGSWLYIFFEILIFFLIIIVDVVFLLFIVFFVGLGMEFVVVRRIGMLLCVV